jgi:hypothetical protein
MKTPKELETEFRNRKTLRKLSEKPIIGKVIKSLNPYGMFTEDKES